MRVAYVEVERDDRGHCVKSLEEKMQISRKSEATENAKDDDLL